MRSGASTRSTAAKSAATALAAVGEGGSVKSIAAGPPVPRQRRRDKKEKHRAEKRAEYHRRKQVSVRTSSRLNARALTTRPRTGSAPWLPSNQTIFGIVSADPGYIQFHICASNVPQMLQWVAPGLLECTGVALARKPTRCTTPPRHRGAMAFVSLLATDSTVHCDTDDGLLLVVCGTREVSWAEPSSATADGCMEGGDGVRYCDQRIAWPPIGASKMTLHAGDALLLPRGWWHRVTGTPG